MTVPVKVQSSDQPQDSASVPAAGAHATQYLSSCDSYHGLSALDLQLQSVLVNRW